MLKARAFLEPLEACLSGLQTCVKNREVRSITCSIGDRANMLALEIILVGTKHQGVNLMTFPIGT